MGRREKRTKRSRDKRRERMIEKMESERDNMCMERKNGSALRATERGNRNVQERIEVNGGRREKERERASRRAEAKDNRRRE